MVNEDCEKRLVLAVEEVARSAANVAEDLRIFAKAADGLIEVPELHLMGKELLGPRMLHDVEFQMARYAELAKTLNDALEDFKQSRRPGR